MKNGVVALFLRLRLCFGLHQGTSSDGLYVFAIFFVSQYATGSAGNFRAGLFSLNHYQHPLSLGMALVYTLANAINMIGTWARLGFHLGDSSQKIIKIF